MAYASGDNIKVVFTEARVSELLLDGGAVLWDDERKKSCPITIQALLDFGKGGKIISTMGVLIT